MNIKGLAGSIATLANWFFSWLITMTANLLLAWSSGGFSLSLSLFFFSLCQHRSSSWCGFWLFLDSNFHDIRSGLCIHSGVCDSVGSWDQRENAWRTSSLIQMRRLKTSSFFVVISLYISVLDKNGRRNKEVWDFSSCWAEKLLRFVCLLCVNNLLLQCIWPHFQVFFVCNLIKLFS